MICGKLRYTCGASTGNLFRILLRRVACSRFVESFEFSTLVGERSPSPSLFLTRHYSSFVDSLAPTVSAPRGGRVRINQLESYAESVPRKDRNRRVRRYVHRARRTDKTRFSDHRFSNDRNLRFRLIEVTMTRRTIWQPAIPPFDAREKFIRPICIILELEIKI